MTCGEQAVEDELEGFPVLEGLAIGQNDGLDLVAGEGLGQPFEIKRGDGFVGDDGHLLARDMRRKQLGLRQQVGTDVDGIATLAEIDLKCPHEAPTMKKGTRIAQFRPPFNGAEGPVVARVFPAPPSAADAHRSR